MMMLSLFYVMVLMTSFASHFLGGDRLSPILQLTVIIVPCWLGTLFVCYRLTKSELTVKHLAEFFSLKKMNWKTTLLLIPLALGSHVMLSEVDNLLRTILPLKSFVTPD